MEEVCFSVTVNLQNHMLSTIFRLVLSENFRHLVQRSLRVVDRNYETRLTNKQARAFSNMMTESVGKHAHVMELSLPPNRQNHSIATCCEVQA